jgi:hypothetical protein
MIYFAYYTQHTLYESLAKCLEKDFNRFNLSYCLQREPHQTRFKNLLLRPLLIAQTLEEYNQPIVSLDVDCRILRKPTIFDTLSCDIACRLYNEKTPILGTIYLEPTHNTFNFLKQWYVLMKESGNNQQTPFRKLWRSLPLNKGILPDEYAVLKREGERFKESVIVHDYISRRLFMPTSQQSNLVWCVSMIRKIKPTKVLDIGVGFGKWGFLCRDYLEAACLRMKKEDWKIQIDGIEPCETYITPLTRYIYNTIKICTVEECLSELHGYDLVIMNDVLEHLEKSVATVVLEHMIANNKFVMATIPLGDQLNENDDIAKEYPYEKHRSIWEGSDFINHPNAKYIEHFTSRHPCGKIGLLFERDNYEKK